MEPWQLSIMVMYFLNNTSNNGWTESENSCLSLAAFKILKIKFIIFK